MAIMGKICKFVAKESKQMLKDVVGAIKLPLDIHSGYKQGARLSQIKKQSIFSGIRNRSIGVVRKGIAPHMGGIFGLVSYPIPIPGISTGFYFLGKEIGKGVTKILR